jgi:two-component system cell cycle sensor histidine kinase/response regulator CckA
MDLPQDTILVVDDEPTVLNFCKLILSRSGYQVLEARTGADGLQVAQSAGVRIRLALLDVVMPGMNGIELANRLRQLDPKMEVLLMSGYSVNEIRNIAGGDHPYRIIWKPFKTESLLRMIQTVLDGQARVSA